MSLKILLSLTVFILIASSCNCTNYTNTTGGDVNELQIIFPGDENVTLTPQNNLISNVNCYLSSTTYSYAATGPAGCGCPSTYPLAQTSPSVYVATNGRECIDCITARAWSNYGQSDIYWFAGAPCRCSASTPVAPGGYTCISCASASSYLSYAVALPSSSSEACRCPRSSPIARVQSNGVTETGGSFCSDCNSAWGWYDNNDGWVWSAVRDACNCQYPTPIAAADRKSCSTCSALNWYYTNWITQPSGYSSLCQCPFDTPLATLYTSWYNYGTPSCSTCSTIGVYISHNEVAEYTWIGPACTCGIASGTSGSLLASNDRKSCKTCATAYAYFSYWYAQPSWSSDTCKCPFESPITYWNGAWYDYDGERCVTCGFAGLLASSNESPLYSRFGTVCTCGTASGTAGNPLASYDRTYCTTCSASKQWVSTGGSVYNSMCICSGLTPQATADRSGCQAPQCGAGKYYTSGSITCNACPINTYSTATSTTSCTSCATPSFTWTTGSSTCVTCSPGYKADFTTKTCVACLAGQYLSALSTCTSCDAGKYALAGSATCASCNTGTYSFAAASACSVCAAGSFTTSTSTCTTCAAGTYSSTAASATCTPCATGSTSVARASACTVCPAGSFTTSTTSCTPCLAGYFNNVPGSTSCKQCLQGTYIASPGAITCTACAAGKYGTTAFPSSESICASCAAGTYSSTTGLSACSQCQSGYYSTGSATSCTQITTQCTNGYYMSSSGSPSSNSVCTKCTACPSGTYISVGCSTTSNVNTQACSVCRACSVGQYIEDLKGVCTGTSAIAPQPSDTACSPCKTCSDMQYINDTTKCTGTTTYDTSKCANCTSFCPVGSYIIAGCDGLGYSPSVDRCSTCTACQDQTFIKLTECTGKTRSAEQTCTAGT